MTLMTRTLTKILLISAAVVSLSGCIRTPEWTLFYVADQTPLPTEIAVQDHITGYYNSLEQCQAKGAGMLHLQLSSVPAEQAFVCGELCQVDEQEQLQCKSLAVGAERDAI
ncbi:hypothetical protein [Shewanella polaris]|uniref:Lipoprotein n=1 Tax=Shewanella polaris TaxID=2588449 RepID=A0A4Y5YBD7_9GAMM|nr:hypothetical protein [Shewanella polaris]QDE29833.1 hypothetical protein FH971_01895 [Shewanella polaris]